MEDNNFGRILAPLKTLYERGEKGKYLNENDTETYKGLVAYFKAVKEIEYRLLWGDADMDKLKEDGEQGV